MFGYRHLLSETDWSHSDGSPPVSQTYWIGQIGMCADHAGYADAVSQQERGQILVVEDDQALAQMMALHLESFGYAVRHCSDGPSAVAAFANHRPDLVLLDIGLPGTMSGIDVCRWLRGQDDWTPIIFLSARDDEVDRVLGLELGADDYVTKPFSPREVVARVSGLLRRVEVERRTRDIAPDAEIGTGAVRLNLGERRAYLEGVEISLTTTEFDLLATLAGHPGQVFSRDQLLARVWGSATTAGPRTVDVHVAQVRAKLVPHQELIRTVRGIGYGMVRSGGGARRE